MARTPSKAPLKMRIHMCLMAHLYNKVEKLLNQRVDELIIRDALLRGDGVRGFAYKGKNYWVKGEKVHVPMFPRLSKNNRALMDDLIAEMEEIEAEKAQVSFYLTHVLNSSDNPVEYLPKFPSGLRQMLSKLYKALDIPVEGLQFAEVQPPHNVANSYEMLRCRVAANLLLE